MRRREGNDNTGNAEVHYREFLEHLTRDTHQLSPSNLDDDGGVRDSWRAGTGSKVRTENLTDVLGTQLNTLQRELDEGQQDLHGRSTAMLEEGKQLTKQLTEFREQCRRESAEALSMVVESRRMFAVMTQDRDRLQAECDTLRDELAHVRSQSSRAADDESALVERCALLYAGPKGSKPDDRWHLHTRRANESELNAAAMRKAVVRAQDEANRLRQVLNPIQFLSRVEFNFAKTQRALANLFCCFSGYENWTKNWLPLFTTSARHKRKMRCWCVNARWVPPYSHSLRT